MRGPIASPGTTEPPPLLLLLNRLSLSAAIIAVSVLAHLGFVGAIVFAERRHLPPSELRAMDVDLVPPEELEPKKAEPVTPPKPPEPPKQAELKPPEPQKPKLPEAAQSLPPKPKGNAPEPQSETADEPQSSQPPPPEPKVAAKPAKPDVPQGGPAGEGKSKLTPEEIASLRAQVQKCWKLPVGIPGIMGLEVILRVPFGPKGQLAGEPVLLQAPASERGPLLVGIALNALQSCYPYKLPPAKYADWKTLDLKFNATGMLGLGAPQKLQKRG